MGDETGISWTEATWNPWMGCTKVSPGCAHCYMFREQRQYGHDPELVRRSKTLFRAPIRWPDGKLIFTCSWSDWFHPDADGWRDEAWEVIRETPRHTYQILTKRTELVLERLPADWGDGYPNVWLGVSIENSRFTWRADELREIPAALRFISAEPLLGSLFEAALDLRNGDNRENIVLKRRPLDLTGFSWVIVGGESGSRVDARPMHPAWAREIRDACIYGHPHAKPRFHGAGITSMNEEDFDRWWNDRPKFHFKQWGSWEPSGEGDTLVLPDGSRPGRIAIDAYGLDTDGGQFMHYAGPNPKSGGKLLDGVEWCEIPDLRASTPA